MIWTLWPQKVLSAVGPWTMFSGPWGSSWTDKFVFFEYWPESSRGLGHRISCRCCLDFLLVTEIENRLFGLGNSRGPTAVPGSRVGLKLIWGVAGGASRLAHKQGGEYKDLRRVLLVIKHSSFFTNSSSFPRRRSISILKPTTFSFPSKIFPCRSVKIDFKTLYNAIITFNKVTANSLIRSTCEFLHLSPVVLLLACVVLVSQ